MTAKARPHPTVAEVLLRHLAELGIDHIFANAGTDFPSIVEALWQAKEHGEAVPNAIAVPHENLAVAMACGHYLVSGRPQAVMLHVNVGTANAICALMNAYRERIPIVVAAGRTPFTEAGLPGSRSLFIHWSQEMFDQAGMLRETVKWDYELKMGEQAIPMIDRAFSLATSEPKGPVYVTLPREVLAMPAPPGGPQAYPQPATRPVVPDEATIAAAAAILARAERPVIITASLGQSHAAVAALGDLAQRFALPVVSHVPKSLCLPTDHPMHLGFAPAPFVAEADAIVVLECDVPWIPAQVQPPAGAKVIHIGIDPLFVRYGLRNFPCDLAVAGDPALALPMLARALAAEKPGTDRIEARRSLLGERRRMQRAAIDELYERVRRDVPIHPAVLTRAVDKIRGGDGILVNELGVLIDHLSLTTPGTYFQQSSAGALGFGLGAALGAKLAAPDRFVVAVVGDGSYMFGNPTPAHFISRACNLPVLFVVTNNGGWGSVRSETEIMYPGGENRRADRLPLTALEPAPDYERVIEASGGYGERVAAPQDLDAALERAARVVRVEKRQALVNVICRML